MPRMVVPVGRRYPVGGTQAAALAVVLVELGLESVVRRHVEASGAPVACSDLEGQDRAALVVGDGVGIASRRSDRQADDRRRVAGCHVDAERPVDAALGVQQRRAVDPLDAHARIPGCRGLDRDVDECAPIGAGARRSNVLGHHDRGDVGDGRREAVGRVHARDGVERIVGSELARGVPAGCGAGVEAHDHRAELVVAAAPGQVEPDRDRVIGCELERLRALEAVIEGGRLHREPVDRHRLIARVLEAHHQAAGHDVEAPLLDGHREPGRERRRRRGRGARGEDEPCRRERGDERERAERAGAQHPARHGVTAPRRRGADRRASGGAPRVVRRPPRSRARPGRRGRRRRPGCRRRRPGAGRC